MKVVPCLWSMLRFAADAEGDDFSWMAIGFTFWVFWRSLRVLSDVSSAAASTEQTVHRPYS